MNNLIVKKHHQNIQMNIQNLMLKQILASVSVNVSLHILGVPDIASLTRIYTISTSNITHPPTYERLSRQVVPYPDGILISILTC